MYPDEDEEDFQELLDHLMKMRQEIPEPLTDEDTADMIEYFAKSGYGFIDVVTEKFHLGPDSNGYIIIANLTPQDRNPNQAYYFLLKHPDFKQLKIDKYKIEFVSSFDEDEDIEPDDYEIGYVMNIYECMKKICSHWIAYSYPFQ